MIGNSQYTASYSLFGKAILTFGLLAYNSTDELMNVLCKLKNVGCYEEIRLNCNSAKKELVNESWSKKLEILFRGE